jgi:DNA repair protein RadC
LGDISIAALKIAHAAAIRLVRARAAEQPLLSNWQALEEYLHADMAHDAVERFRVLHLNKWKPVVRQRVRIAFMHSRLISLALLHRSACAKTSGREIVHRTVPAFAPASM